MGTGEDGPSIPGGGKEREGGDPLGLDSLAKESIKLGAQEAREAHRAEAFKEASHEVLAGGDEIVKLVSNPEEAHNVSMALAQLAIKILNKE